MPARPAKNLKFNSKITKDAIEKFVAKALEAGGIEVPSME